MNFLKEIFKNEFNKIDLQKPINRQISSMEMVEILIYFEKIFEVKVNIFDMNFNKDIYISDFLNFFLENK